MKNPFKQSQNKELVEKPIVTYYAKYIGHFGSDRKIPTEEDVYCHVYNDMIKVNFIKKPNKGTYFAIPYERMIEMENLDAGKKISLERVVALSGIGLFWRIHHILTIIKYIDDESALQTIALDFLENVKYAQPLIYQRFLEGKVRRDKTEERERSKTS